VNPPTACTHAHNAPTRAMTRGSRTAGLGPSDPPRRWVVRPAQRLGSQAQPAARSSPATPGTELETHGGSDNSPPAHRLQIRHIPIEIHPIQTLQIQRNNHLGGPRLASLTGRFWHARCPRYSLPSATTKSTPSPRIREILNHPRGGNSTRYASRRCKYAALMGESTPWRNSTLNRSQYSPSTLGIAKESYS